MSLLEVSDLEAGYGDVLIVRGASMRVEPSEIVTIIGPNGAGKSTLLKAIFGMTNILGGSVRFNGDDVTRMPAHRLVELGAAFVPQTDNVFPRLSIRENLEMGAFRRKSGTNERIEELLGRFPDLGSRPGEQAGRLSGGQRQTLAMCRALMLDPTLLLVDEPTAALSPAARQDLFRQIQAIRDTGVAILMVEQNAREALEISDRGYVLVAGAVALEDRAETMLANEDIGRMFLGRTEGVS
ncbi:MAG: ABC transporter ATP-binding protein [Dehalococcoidia bacterium]|nr:ABC transporter ATP-binding protein [Dehalococcoidia bacterium]MCB9484298.1 ABC transporter ATP-binding protein [Dehalococcoidia bacterium]